VVEVAVNRSNKPGQTPPCSHEELVVLLDFDTHPPRWRYLPCRASWTGKAAGSLLSNGYWCVTIGRKQYKAHRVAYFYFTGIWPTEQIDHINGDRLDNRACNLRMVSGSVNCRNRGSVRACSTTGLRGVHWPPSVQARGHRPRAIAIDATGKPVALGAYDTVEECAAVAAAYRRANYPGYTGRGDTA
jgi:hypothetical protein